MTNEKQRNEKEPSMQYPPMINILLERYPRATVLKINQHLNQRDFEDQKSKQNEYPIEGAALGIITTDADMIVLTQRTKPHKGWALPGGRVEKGEEFDAALTREVQEECGVPITITSLAVIEDKRFISPEDEVLEFWLAVFRAHISSGHTPYQTQEAVREGLELGIFSIDDLPDNMVLRDRDKVEAYFLL